MAYIDHIKVDYSDQTDELRKEYIKRDKKYLAQIIQDRIAKDIDNIVNRWYELNDIGHIPVEEKFLDLLKEAEQLYSFGYYTGAVAIVGIATEEYSKFLYCKYIGGVDKLTQKDRIDELQKFNHISNILKNKLHDIRKIRNECMHYNAGFKTLQDEELKLKAKNMLNLYKDVLADIVDKNVDSINKVISAFNSDSEREFVLKCRNIMMKNGVNLQLPPNIKNQVRQSVYHVEEVDIEGTLFKEITLFDIFDGELPLVVDLTIPQSDHISESGLKEGNIIFATLISSVSDVGMTSEWNLINIDVP
ncbi:hypothetical protein [Oribacterium sp. WCC10]|uniref:hypothetical protein n=1 Tax=Oribacterium sp. WCC10 TaxID=1855343 RepID=UPI0008E66006|nr:hypothetical protein [Oribacterium sp. WCC10]SFG83674.1 hypothetical protein SAMN05216356_1435 [Oribacterium sp. WCC10]